MSWRTEWQAISNQIAGLLDAGRFYLESFGPRRTDVYDVGRKQLLPHSEAVYSAVVRFGKTFKASLPLAAVDCLTRFVRTFGRHFKDSHSIDALASLQFMITALASFRSEFDYHLSDITVVAKRLSERAFLHLQRSIVADHNVRENWIKAFETGGETQCEKLGGAHLLMHGIWAFKVGAEGERTDLVFGEALTDVSAIERSAEALVLTEWKLIRSNSNVERVASDARKQATRYSTGALGGLELTDYRFIVLVSKLFIQLPRDHLEDGVLYRHINIAVNPQTPSKG
jgi:hypothetical protein